MRPVHAHKQVQVTPHHMKSIKKRYEKSKDICLDIPAQRTT
ncbi:hypothetical protein EBME_0216 [bacterium endosymbiont of Mortierella elongata FMR23-6]|nr:hypothetical protein EBME_0216 [bacterium endosymbiont of Mortierella elongata FMR23-6]